MQVDHQSSSTDAFGLRLDGLISPWSERFSPGSTRRLACRFSDDLPDHPDAWWLRQEGDALVVGWRDYAEYRVDAAARSIDISLGAVDVAEATQGLLLSALPLALPLFDLEPLHASAVTVGDCGVVLLGTSGAGKSTLAAGLASLGAEFLSDDATAIDDEGDILPGPPVGNPRFQDADQLTIGSYNGKVVRLIRHTETTRVRPGAIVVLNPTPRYPFAMEQLAGRELFEALLGNVRIPWVFKERRQARQLAIAASLGGLPGARLRFDPAGENEKRAAEAVLEWTQGL